MLKLPIRSRLVISITLTTINEAGWPESETWFDIKKLLSEADEWSNKPNQYNENAAVSCPYLNGATEMEPIYR